MVRKIIQAYCVSPNLVDTLKNTYSKSKYDAISKNSRIAFIFSVNLIFLKKNGQTRSKNGRNNEICEWYKKRINAYLDIKWRIIKLLVRMGYGVGGRLDEGIIRCVLYFPPSVPLYIA